MASACGDGKLQQQDVTGRVKVGGIILPLIGPLSASLPAAVLSHLCYWIQHFLATSSRQISFTLVNETTLISVSLPEIFPDLF